MKGTWRRARRGAADLTSIWFSGTRSEALHLRPWLSQGVLLLVPKSQHSCHFLTVTGVGGRRRSCAIAGASGPPRPLLLCGYTCTPCPSPLRACSPATLSARPDDYLHPRRPPIALFWLLRVASSVAPRAGVWSRSQVHSSAGHPRSWHRLPRCRK